MDTSKAIRFVALLTIIIGLSSSVIPAHAASYLPAVSAGQWAKYQPLYDKCQPSNSPMCQGQANGGINDTLYGLIQIQTVSGTTIAFQLFTQYKNGTTSSQGAQVDVATGSSNITGLAGGPSDYFVLAGGLQKGDPIWNTNTAPTFNQTTTEQVLGVSRTVNTLNYTTASSAYGSSFSISTVFQFDQLSGLFIQIYFNATTTSTMFGNSQTAFALGMVDNNIWRSSTLPDFSINAVSSITFQTGSSGTAAISFASQNGFNSAIQLSVNAPSGLTCTLDHYTIQSSGTVTLTCTGQPGTYTLTINANSGYSTHSDKTTVTVNSAPAANQPASGLPLTYAYIAAVVIAVIAIAGAIFFLRRKPATNQTPQPMTSNPQSPEGNA
jgi:hypothetical protein